MTAVAGYFFVNQIKVKSSQVAFNKNK